MTTQSPHPAKDNRRALLLRLPLQTAIDWTRIRPSNNWRQFRPRLGGGRLLSEADEFAVAMPTTWIPPLTVLCVF